MSIYYELFRLLFAILFIIGFYYYIFMSLKISDDLKKLKDLIHKLLNELGDKQNEK
jgi:HAMP domain-containing protein